MAMATAKGGAAPAKPVVLIITGSSNTGLACARYLAQEHADKVSIRVVIRSEKYQELFDGLDVEIVKGDLKQKAHIKAMFKDDVNTAYLATPNTKDRAAVGKIFIDACIEHGVDYPVIASMVGTSGKATTLYHKQFAELEKYIAAKAGTPVKRQKWDTGKQLLQPVILRCGQFHQNLYPLILAIKTGTFYYPLGPDGVIPCCDLDDVGKAAAHVMLDPEAHGGKTYNLISEYLSGGDIGAALTRGMSTVVKYEMVDKDVATAAFLAAGVADWKAKAMAEVLQWYSVGNGQGESTKDLAAIIPGSPSKLSAFAKRSLKPLLAAK